MSEILKALHSRNKTVELKSGLVELGLINSIQKLSKEVSKEWEIGRREEERIKKAATEAITAFKQSRVKANEVLGMIDKAEKSLKDLGMEIPANLSNLKNDALSAIKDGGEKIKKLQTVK